MQLSTFALLFMLCITLAAAMPPSNRNKQVSPEEWTKSEEYKKLQKQHSEEERKKANRMAQVYASGSVKFAAPAGKVKTIGL